MMGIESVLVLTKVLLNVFTKPGCLFIQFNPLTTVIKLEPLDSYLAITPLGSDQFFEAKFHSKAATRRY